MGRGYEDNPRQRFFSRPRNHDPLVVDRPWNDPGAGQSQDPSGLLVTGIFNPSRLARIEHGDGANQHRLLHSTHNHDLVRMTACRSEIAQISRKCLAQVGVAAIRRVAQQVDAFFRQNLRSEALPHSDRKFIYCGNARDQRNPCACARCPEVKLISDASIRNCFHAIGNANGALDRLVGFRLASRQKSFGKKTRNKCSGRRLCAKITFGMKF